MRRLVRRTAVVVTAVVVFAPGQVVLGSAQTTTLSSASGESSGIFLTVNDPEIFLDDTILEPPEVHVGYARAGLERTGTGAALAAPGFSEYMNVLGAVPELGPAFLPPEALPVFELLIELAPPGLAESVRNLTQASVRGQPPQGKDATYVPGDGAEGGVMRVALAEGPTAHAVSTYADLPASLLLDASAVDTEVTVTTVASGRRADVISVLRDVTIAEVIEIDAIRVTATANADGGDGIADGDVTIEGVTVAGLPAVINQDGIQAADQAIPLGTQPINAALEAAGIQITAPGSVATSSSGNEASTVAHGPTIHFEDPNGRSVGITLGRAVASSDLLALDLPAAPPPPAPPAPAPAPSTNDAQGIPAAPQLPTSPPVQVAPDPATAPPASDPPVVASPQEEEQLMALDREPLILAGEDKRRGVENVYMMLFLPLLLIASVGVIRPWRVD